MERKEKVLDEISNNISRFIKEKYSPRYYFQRVTQSKSGSFLFGLKKKKGHLTQTEKANLIENVEEIDPSVYRFYSRRNGFILTDYIPFARLVKQKSNNHFQFLVTEKDYA